jgi:hypothetical protein
VTEPQQTDPLLRQINATLDKAVDALDGATQSRLRAARREALAVRQQRPGWWLPLAGMATAATVAVLTLSLWLLQPQQPTAVMPTVEDMALLSDEAELDFYEDLDFYLWLDSERQAG